MKGKLDTKKLGITIAACLTLFSVTALAAGEAAGIVSWNRIDTRTRNFEDLLKIEEKAGMDMTADELFDMAEEIINARYNNRIMIYYNSAWLIGLCTVAIYDAARSVLLAVHNSYLDCVLLFL